MLAGLLVAVLMATMVLLEPIQQLPMAARWYFRPLAEVGEGMVKTPSTLLLVEVAAEAVLGNVEEPVQEMLLEALTLFLRCKEQATVSVLLVEVGKVGT